MLDIAIQFAWGLHFAHEAGLVHQDVKPANVMMTPEGTAKVTDFGLARARAAAGERPATGRKGQTVAVAGSGFCTREYASPEQLGGKALTRRTDVWSWGVSILHMFKGDLTWMTGVAAGEVLNEYLEAPAEELPCPRMPEPLARLLRQCFELEPEKRPRDMLEAAGGLKDIYKQAAGEEYLREDPRAAGLQAGSLNNKALSMLDLGKREEAENLLAEALKLDPHHVESVFNRGLLYWRSGRMTDDQLVLQLEEVRKTHRDEWLDEYLLGLVHLERSDAESAVKVLDEAAKAVPGKAEVVGALQTARAGIGKWRGTLRTFEGHAGDVTSVAISPDGVFGLSGSEDKTLIFWDLAAGSRVRALEGHTSGVETVAISPEGKFGLSGSYFKTLMLWDMPTGKCLRVFRAGHAGEVRSVAISPDGRFGLSGSLIRTRMPGTAVLWYHSRQMTSHPPQPRLIIRVGVSGHRPEGLAGADMGSLRLAVFSWSGYRAARSVPSRFDRRARVIREVGITLTRDFLDGTQGHT